MAAPAGYVPLDLVGFTDKGAYVSESTYAANDIVHNDNKMYRSLQDNNTGHALPVSPETETEWWELWLSGGAEDLEAITVKDTSNVTGGGAGKVVVAQTLIDAIAQKVMNDLVAKSMIDNNLLGTDATHVLASPQGKALDEKITQLYSNTAKNQNAVSENPDEILITSIRTINGWSGALRDKIPSQLLSSWIICITTSNYEDIIGESLLQILISSSKPYYAIRGGNTSGKWNAFEVYQMQKDAS